MRSVHALPIVCGLALACAACGGGYGGSSPSPTPETPPASQAPSVTVSIVGERGNRSFDPNPVTPGAQRTIAWHNADGTVHRIVANDNSFDTGNIGANGTSAPITVPADGINYHCVIHPDMVGAVNNSGGATPPCTGPYC